MPAVTGISDFPMPARRTHRPSHPDQDDAYYFGPPSPSPTSMQGQSFFISSTLEPFLLVLMKYKCMLPQFMNARIYPGNVLPLTIHDLMDIPKGTKASSASSQVRANFTRWHHFTNPQRVPHRHADLSWFFVLTILHFHSVTNALFIKH